MQGPYCHCCILPNRTACIILWLLMSRGFSSIHHHVECGHYQEIIGLHTWDSKFKAKRVCLRSYGIPAALILSTDSQMMRKWTPPILWQMGSFHARRRSFLKEGRRVKDNLWLISIIA
jgi:hypothetical protein